MDNLLLMLKFSHFAIKKLYFKWSFNNISGNSGPLFSLMNLTRHILRVFFVQEVNVLGSLT